MSSVLRILRSKDNDNNVFYSVRLAMCVEYDEMYAWLSSHSYKCVSESFPWDMFSISDTEDKEEFEQRFAEYIVDDPDLKH